MSDQIPTGTFLEVSKVSKAYPATDCLTSSLPPCNPSPNGGESTFKDIPNGSTLCTVNTKTVKATFENGVQSLKDLAKRRNMEGETHAPLGEKSSHVISISQDSAILSKQAHTNCARKQAWTRKEKQADKGKEIASTVEVGKEKESDKVDQRNVDNGSTSNQMMVCETTITELHTTTPAP
ncbi:unnamed protein product [Ilex paraguariensis]|uniref:Uncharacterized protein n=1 Tax=Ilex paraguariensis TaxID=185542 RepID=A0ABC8RKH2_9AQUA